MHPFSCSPPLVQEAPSSLTRGEKKRPMENWTPGSHIVVEASEATASSAIYQDPRRGESSSPVDVKTTNGFVLLEMV